MSKVIKKMIGFKIDFLLILGGFWEGLGGQVGPKIQQNSIKNQYGKVMEILIRKMREGWAEPARPCRPRWWGPLNSINKPTPRNQQSHHNTPLGLKARWRIATLLLNPY